MFINVILYVPYDEQEIERKQRKQFKGLFDKKPGEISDAGTEDKADQITSEDQKNDDEENADSGSSDEYDDEEDADSGSSDESREAVDDAQQRGWFSLFWPSGSRIFSALGLQRCTIL